MNTNSNNSTLYMEEESQQFDMQKKADELANAFSWEGLEKRKFITS